MTTDPLVELSRALHSALDAALYPLLVLAAIAALVEIVVLVRRSVRERGRLHRAPPRTQAADRDGPPKTSGAFLGFHTAAERAGYPAMLVVTVAALALAVAAVVLLVLTNAVWAVPIAVLADLGALALLGAAINAAFAEGSPESAETAHAATAQRRRPSSPVARPAESGQHRSARLRAGAARSARPSARLLDTTRSYLAENRWPGSRERRPGAALSEDR
jgi:hypothetical protein